MPNRFVCYLLLALVNIPAAESQISQTRIGAASVTVSGVSNGADFSTAVAPGSLASLFGTALASGIASAAAVPVATTLNGTTVNVNGRPAPITYLSPTQINFQVPITTTPGTASVTVTFGGQTSTPVQFTVAAAAPGGLPVLR